MKETVGSRIRAIARQRGLGDGAELATKIGVSYETLRKWTEGSSGPNRAPQDKLAALLGVPPAAFMHGVDLPKAMAQAARPKDRRAELAAALATLSEFLAEEMSAEQRDEAGVLLSQLAQRRGVERYQHLLADLLTSTRPAHPVDPAPNEPNVETLLAQRMRGLQLDPAGMKRLMANLLNTMDEAERTQRKAAPRTAPNAKRS
jgi:transcriptional regulator with XRE-family HTH domain